MRWPVILTSVALVACGSPDTPDADEPADQAQVEEASLAPPRAPEFRAAWAEQCPDAPEIGSVVCQAEGLGGEVFACDFALGEDEYRRNTADLVQSNGRWMLAEPETACDSAG